MNHIQELAKQMAACGVRHVFGIPGSGASLGLIDELEHLGVAFHLTCFEGAAALMAGAAGRLGPACGAALSIKGPGLANMASGLAACQLDAMPLVGIAEAYPPDAPPQKSHKRMDHASLAAGVSKGRRYWSGEADAFAGLEAWAKAEVPGPVQLDLAPAVVQDDRAPEAPATQDAPLPPEARKLLEAAERPLVIVGTLAGRLGLSQQLNELGLPVCSTAAAKGVVNEYLEHAAGVYTGAGDELAPEGALLEQCDLVIGIGLRYNELLGTEAFKVLALQIDPLGLEPGNALGFAACVSGTPAQLHEIFQHLQARQWGLELVAQSIQRLRERLLQGPFLPAQVCEALEQRFVSGFRLVPDTGNFCTVAEHMLRLRRPEHYVAAAQGRYMGVCLPLGIGSALQDPSVPTVVLTGDGGVGMFVAEAALAVARSLPLLVVFCSDTYLGTVRGAALAKGLSQAPTRVAQSLGQGWTGVMQALGLEARCVRNRQELEQALAGWQAAAPLFLELPFDPDAYQAMAPGLRKG